MTITTHSPIALHGFPLSNYYNKVKMVLLEKGVAFTEVNTPLPLKDPALRALSPMGKVPFIVTSQGSISESQAIVDWLEQAFPEPALLPSDPFEAAKVRELTTYIDWHLEICARQLYGSAFFMATGFHGFHVLIGTIFLIVCLARLMGSGFTTKQHFGFEAAAWYWHFVDVVWLFLFAFIYVVFGASAGH